MEAIFDIPNIYNTDGLIFVQVLQKERKRKHGDESGEESMEEDGEEETATEKPKKRPQ